MKRRSGRGRIAAATLVVLAAFAFTALQPATAPAVEPPRSAAGPNDPGRWIETGFSPVPTEYYQGVTAAPNGDVYFDGFTVGFFRTDSALTEEARVVNAIPADVATREGYNHIGDITWDGAEGGRVLLPLECFLFGQGNFCGTGSIGVADPQTLAWRYYVKLDPADIKKAMWAEVSPDGSLLWTSHESDLLAYSTADVSLANAAPDAAPIRPVRTLAGAVPPTGVTGATFHNGRLFLAGANRTSFQVWSVDTDTGERRLEIERILHGESEGLVTFDGLGGLLHWMIGEITFTGAPTYGSGRTGFVHFAPVNHPPDCSAVHPTPSSLWPPNHKLVKVELVGITDPDGDPVAIEVGAVTQDEPVHKKGRHGSAPDAFKKSSRPGVVFLRAERRGGGDGRVYRIAFTAADGAGGSCTGAVAVAVPRKGNGAAVDSSPPSYDSLAWRPHGHHGGDDDRDERDRHGRARR